MTGEQQACTCTWYSENRGGGHFETMIEPEPDCPEHGEKLLDVAAVAAAAGLSTDTVRFYHKTAVRNRAKGTIASRDLPAPVTSGRDGLAWNAAEIREWVEQRQNKPRPGPVSRDTIREIIAALDRGQISKARTIATQAL